MKKRFTNAFLLVTLALAAMMVLSGCGGNNPSSGKSEDTNSEEVTLTVWGDQANQSVTESAFKKMNDAFMEKHPNIKIDYQFSGSDQTLDTAVRANSLPDVFYVQGNKTPKMELYVKSGALLPLDEYNLDTSRYTEDAIEYGTVDGKLYSSLPSFMDSQLMYYNKATFKEYGIDEPKTYAEFVSILETLKKEGITPIAMPGKDSFYRSWLSAALMTTLADDAMGGIKNGESDFSDPNIVKAFQAYRDFTDKDYFSKDLVTLDGGGAQLAFTNGNAAMIADGTWTYETYKGAIGDDLGTFYVPGEDGKAIAPLSFSNFTTYAVSANTKHPKEAVEYIKFLSSLEAQQIFSTETGSVPTIDDIQPRDEGVDELTQFDSLGKNFGAIVSKLSTDKVDLTDVYMNEILSGLLTGEITGQDAVEKLNEALQKTK